MTLCVAKLVKEVIESINSTILSDTNVTHYSYTLSIQGFQKYSTIEWE